MLVLTNSIKGLYSFRRELIEELIIQKYEVVIAAPEDNKMSYFTQMGCSIVKTSINSRGTNPITDLKLFISYFNLVKNLKPNVVLTYTIKPNVYGGLACRLLRVFYIANITGLGTSIESRGLIQKISLFLYRTGLKKAKCIFFQNEPNKLFFNNNNIVKSKSRLVPGSGVNLTQHSFEEYPEDDRLIKFLFIGRIMKDKGIDELIEAANRVKEKYPNVQFDIVGDREEDYTQLLKELDNNKIIKYHGRQNDVHTFIKKSHATINPSYHEGMSNVLLESAATGRPVLASNIPGCRETFDEETSGFGFEAKNADSLVEAIIKFIELPYDKKKSMGFAGRRKMEKEYNRKIVINAYIDEINNL
ncbi:glycosyltransferase family 4 protein [Paenisporosarcina antarctica]|uniref:glycosyltransferase family 4 protein n=1 Tax=Paenisporosarcina antarctica TaxID=417367 RepID=UPI002ADE8EFB|nr:glycosyltransferase family 4 protein [Paenisporosarcina antarctica]